MPGKEKGEKGKRKRMQGRGWVPSLSLTHSLDDGNMQAWVGYKKKGGIILECGRWPTQEGREIFSAWAFESSWWPCVRSLSDMCIPLPLPSVEIIGHGKKLQTKRRLETLEGNGYGGWMVLKPVGLTLKRTMQAPRAWYNYGRILFNTSTPLHQMGFLICQIEHLRKIYTSLE